MTLNVGKQQNGVTLGRWLLRGPSHSDVLLTSTTHAGMPRPLVHKQSGVVGTTTTSVSYVASGDAGSGTAPEASMARRGKASMAGPTARPLYSSNSPQAVTLSIPRARQPGWTQRLPLFQLVRTRPPQRRWLRRPNLLRLNHLDGVTTTTSSFACRRKGYCQ